MIKLKLTSALEKYIPDTTAENIKDYKGYPVFKNETFALHAVYYQVEGFLKEECFAEVECSLEGAKVDLYALDYVPVRVAEYPDVTDDDYISHTSCLLPDIMRAITPETLLFAPYKSINMLRVEVNFPEDVKAGEYSLTVRIRSNEKKEEFVEESVKFTLLDAELPKQDTVVMQWLHCDSIAEYYGLDSLSDTHFEYIEKAVKRAVENGINAVYTPVFTPPLDTAVGGERFTVQLVDVEKNGDKWSFSYKNLDRFCDMALSCGAEYFEISHLFTQWGARHAPKIMATVDGEYKKVFGWETPAAGEEYVGFLRSFLYDFTSHMKARGLDKKCIFHVSDEPNETQLDSYKSAVNTVRDILEDYTVADAISEVEYYDEGLCRCPIPGVDFADKFLERIPENLWVYYCCSQSKDVSNRFISQPLARTRIIGAQMWKYKCTGFLHWGYNFYSSQFSRYKVNPYIITDGDYFAPAGDAFSVYPGANGECIPSLRLRAFYEGLCDIRALEAASQKYGRDAVLKLIDEGLERELKFTDYPRGSDYIIDLRAKIGALFN